MLSQLVFLLAAGVCLGFQSVAPPRQDCITRPLPYGECSALCGGGFKTRQLEITQSRIGYGKACPPLTETVPCNEQPCAVDCQVQPGQWSSCSATCGQGTQTKLDQILVEASNGGQRCPSDFQLRQTRPCPNLPPCPVPKDCVIGYTEYSQCTAPCGGGTQTRSAFIVSQAENGGAPCPADLGALSSTRPCNTDIACPQVKDCEYITGEYGDCSATCGQGVQKQHIYIVAQPENGGQACPSEYGLTQTRPCNAGQCPTPVDCEVQWSPFTQCSQTCGGGFQTARGQIVRQATPGGAPCPSYSQLNIQRTCNDFPCVEAPIVDCEIEYGPYGECSAPCGGGFQTRKGYVRRESHQGGVQCPSENSLVERIPCNQQACPQPQGRCLHLLPRKFLCTPNECSAPCGGGGGGFQTRKGYVRRESHQGGVQCPSENSLVERIPCNQQACPQPQDCLVQRAYWSECSAQTPCGPATQTRQLQILKPAQNGGLPCPSSLVQTRSCQLPASQTAQCRPTAPAAPARYGQPQPQPKPQPRPQFNIRQQQPIQRQQFQRIPTTQSRPNLVQQARPATFNRPAVGQTFSFQGSYGQ